MVPIYQADEHATIPGCSMRWSCSRGSDLQEIGAGGPLLRERAIELVRQRARRARRRARRGLIHADV